MVAIFQGAAKPLDKSGNLATMERVAAAASVAGAAIIVFPELFLSGYNLGNRLAAVAEPIGGPSTLTMAEIARTHRIALVAGLPERDTGEIFNSAILMIRLDKSERRIEKSIFSAKKAVSSQGATISLSSTCHLLGWVSPSATISSFPR
jgi:hypothetical protein